MQDDENAFRASGKERRYSWDYDPEMDIYVYGGRTGSAHAADDGPRVRRRGQLLAGRPVDRLHLDARRLQPHAHRRREEAARGRSQLLRRDLHHAGRRFGPAAADERRRVRRRAVLHPRRLAHRLAAFRRDGRHRRRLDDEAGRQRPAADHELRRDELGALRAPFGPVLRLRVEQARASTTSKLFMVDAAGTKEPVRVTYSAGFDGLPVPSPDGTQLAWTSSRGGGTAGQLFLAQWNHEKALEAIAQRAAQTVAATNHETPTDPARVRPGPRGHDAPRRGRLEAPDVGDDTRVRSGSAGG